MTGKRLSNPPIVQTVLAVKLTRTVPLEKLRELSGQYIDLFPNPKKKFQFQQQFAVDTPGQVPPPDIREVGFALSSKDGKESLLLQEGVFAYSSSGPYFDWLKALDRFYEIFSRLEGAVADISISAFITRFVNLIKCPSPFGFNDYFKFSPFVVIPEVHTYVKGINSTYLMQHTTEGLNATIRLLEKSITAENVEFIYDIEIEKTVSLPFRDFMTDRSRFESVRTFKNQLFFESFTGEYLKKFGLEES